MTGLLALLDDIAAIAKAAAAQVDDVAVQASKVGVKVAGSVIDDATKAGAKSLGVVIDDAAVTPKYVQSLPAARELPIVWQIARGSLFNKLVILLPIAMLLNAFAPFLITPILMIGGAYLCFEGAEKVAHLFLPHSHADAAVEPQQVDALHLERTRVAGAIKTDFILSAEIMTIALAAIDAQNPWMEGFVLAIVAIGITALVYGGVAALVKADDIGLAMARAGRLRATRAVGRGIVMGMPGLLAVISIAGTAAMLWVGGSIFIHGIESLGSGYIAHIIHDISASAAQSVPVAKGFVEWMAKAALDGIFGLSLGLTLTLVWNLAVLPVMKAFTLPASAR